MCVFCDVSISLYSDQQCLANGKQIQCGNFLLTVWQVSLVTALEHAWMTRFCMSAHGDPHCTGMCHMNNNKTKTPLRLETHQSLLQSPTLQSDCHSWRQPRCLLQLLSQFGFSAATAAATYCGLKLYVTSPRLAPADGGRTSRPRSTLASQVVHYQTARLRMAGLKSLSPPFLSALAFNFSYQSGVSEHKLALKPFLILTRGVYERTNQPVRTTSKG